MGNAATTRLMILEKGFELIYRNGYQATSIDVIIATTRVTKGAFYYHFKNKEEMGLAVIREIMYPGMMAAMINPLREGGDAAVKIYQMMEGLLLENSFFRVEYGCPAVNLIEEMSPLNEAFRSALTLLMVKWQEAIEQALTGQRLAGKLATGPEPRQIALFIIAGYTGIRNMGKIFGESCYDAYLSQLRQYLKNLS